MGYGFRKVMPEDGEARNSENVILPVFGDFRPFVFMNIHEGMLAVLRIRFSSLRSVILIPGRRLVEVCMLARS